jgi:hypothetical protein
MIAVMKLLRLIAFSHHGCLASPQSTHLEIAIAVVFVSKIMARLFFVFQVKLSVSEGKLADNTALLK